MLLTSLIILLVSSTVTIGRDKSILYSRIAILVLLITELLMINTLIVFPQGLLFKLYISLTWHILVWFFKL